MADHQKAQNVKPTKEAAHQHRTVEPVSQEWIGVQPVELTTLQRSVDNPGLAQPADILNLQRACGNRAVSRLIQAKLMVGPVGDQYEQEADRVAEQVLTMPAPVSQQRSAVSAQSPLQRQAPEEEEVQAKPLAATITPLVQRQEEEEEEVQMMPLVQRRADGSFEAGSELESRLAAHQGRGSPLPDEVRAFMEPHFGANFGGVRVHTGGEAVQMNRELSAQSFTHGQDIYFGTGKYDPGSSAGKWLLAHELTHVVQQTGSRHVHRKTRGQTVAVYGRLPTNRISTKKRLMHLDFVLMKRQNVDYKRIIQKVLGMKVKEKDDNRYGTYGHYWTEIGNREYDGTFRPRESYGWWPKKDPGFAETFKGTEGILNGDGGEHDNHEGDPAEEEFYPAMALDPDNESYESIRDRVTKDIKAFAHGFKGSWNWRFGWGKNCQTFQAKLKKKVGLHNKKAKKWLIDPETVKRGQAVEKAAKQEQEGRERALASVVKWMTVPEEVGIEAYQEDTTTDSQPPIFKGVGGSLRAGGKQVGVTGVTKEGKVGFLISNMVEFVFENNRYWMLDLYWEMYFGEKYPAKQ